VHVRMLRRDERLRTDKMRHPSGKRGAPGCRVSS
jgi:hypothetical protein